MADDDVVLQRIVLTRKLSAAGHPDTVIGFEQEPDWDEAWAMCGVLLGWLMQRIRTPIPDD